jgi:lipoprotein NlpI
LKALVNLGNVLRDQKKYDESIATLEQAIALAPDRANAHLNLGTVLRDAGRFDEAVERMRRAVELDPNVAEAHNNLGTVLQSLARFDEAASEYEEALRLDPQLPDAHFSRATWLLREGDFERGFAEYEWRWKCKTFSDRGFQQPRWDGSPLAGRTILLGPPARRPRDRRMPAAAGQSLVRMFVHRRTNHARHPVAWLRRTRPADEPALCLEAVGQHTLGRALP